MRGRSLLKETSSPSLCAFCAHRLGQARQPSHVQRRFLQSSKPVSKPPAEATAVREDNDIRPPQPSWGRPTGPGKSNGRGPTATWGRPAFGNANGGNLSTGPSINWGRSTITENGGIVDRPMEDNRVGYTPGAGNLLPHEQRARDLMLEKQMKAQQRPVSESQRYRGDEGPSTHRSGRMEPRNETERLDIARRAVEKRNARQIYDRDVEHRDNVVKGIGDPRITRSPSSGHVMGDGEPALPSARKENREDGDAPRWGQLRRRGEAVVEEQRRPKENDQFIEARAQREEQAKTARYTPLGSRSKFSDRDAPRQNSPFRREESQGSRRLQFSPNTPHENVRPAQDESKLRDRYPAFNDRRTDYSQRDRGGFEPRLESRGIRRKFGPRLNSSWGSEGNFESRLEPRGDRGNFEPRQEPRIDQGNSGSRSDEPHKDQEKFASRSFGSDRDTASRPAERTLRQNQASNEQQEDSRSAREGRQKKPRSRYEPEAQQQSYNTAPRGKGKDKAKRRQKFDYGEEADEELEAEAARAELKRQRKREKALKKATAPTPMLLPEYISVSNLAVALKVRLEDFVYKMQELGFEETSHDYILNAENAGLIAQEYNFEPIIDRSESEDLKAREPASDPTILPQRPPVVTIMGHVDHGKTTLLDWLRKSSVAATELGGITQHIGAFSVAMPGGKIITFLDTPGHAAFLSMRQRGANVTDIVILVVAADDSVKPQTIEAINHAKAAKVPIIVAINKIDKEDSNIDRVKQDLARHGVDVEDFGGDTQVVCVSGKTGQGMDELEEAAITLSEILDMRAERDGQAEGWVLEASIKSMGKVATVLVRRGTMRPGDFIVAGNTWARIRCLRNEAGVEIDEAGPGTPVEIDGWREQPLAGDEVLQAIDEAKAKSVVDYRLERNERDKMAEDMEAINESRKAEQEKREREKAEVAAAAESVDKEVEAPTATPEVSGPKDVFFIIKGDVSGSVEAVIDSIAALGNKEVQPHILRSGVGQLSEFDIEHAAAAKGHLINFNTPVEPHISSLAEKNKVSILDHNIIYRLVDDVKTELSKYLPPLITQRVLGEAEIAQVFEITVKGRQQRNIAGCKVRNGTISKTEKVRVMRRGEKVFDGSLASLKNVKKDVGEMKKGGECGMGFEGWFDFQVGDQVQAYEEKHEKRYL